MSRKTFKVGELATRTGLTVRTLHHYDAIGLLRPSHRTESGHRLYSEADVLRLQRLVSLRALGLSLQDIQGLLDRPDLSPREVIRLNRERLRRQIAQQQRLLDLLERLDQSLGRTEAELVSVDEMLQVIEGMIMIENYYTPEQLETLKKRREEFGPDAIRAVEEEWPVLMAKMKAEMEAGTDPSDPRVQALGRRWQELIESFTGGDPGILASLGRLWQDHGQEIATQHGMGFDPALFDYVGKVQAANPDKK